MLYDLTALDCMGFAGGFTLGTVQAGFRLVGKREERAGFGVFNCEVNRHLLGDEWQAQSSDPREWEPFKVNLVFGNPPCSGFSTLSPKKFRGMDSSINSCMWNFADFAARCYPEVAVFESVSAAYRNGRPLMQALRARLEEQTARQWSLHHVLHSAASVGGTSHTRRRYFWLVSQIPFGVEPPKPERVPSLSTIIGDLMFLDHSWDPQPYRVRSPAGWWAEPRLHPDGEVDGHEWYNSSYYRKSMDLITEKTGPWAEGQRLQQRMQMYWDEHGDLPNSWETRKKNLIRSDFWCGASQLTRWRWDEPARVITGAGLESVLHPRLDRTLTHREVARIMGFPDTWQIREFRDRPGSIRQTWGKGIPVDCGRWISGWIRSALLGEPGGYAGEKVGDREYLIDVTNDWKKADVI
jgi:site-specific DNA-cytosine methylase